MTSRRSLTKQPLPIAVLNYALLVLVGLAFLIPLYWLLSSAVKPSDDIYRWPLEWFPIRLDFSNFAGAWTAAPFGRFFVNSIIVMAFGTAFKLVFATMTAYAFVFLKFPAKNILFIVMLGALMIPGNVTLIVNYLTVSSLGWVNTYAGLIAPGIASVFGTFLLRQHMMTLPLEVVEAARVDGAGPIRLLMGVIVPMSRPILITVALVAAVEDWNNFIWPLIVTNTTGMRTLPIGLAFLQDAEGYNNWGVIMAGTVMVAVPVLLLFFVAQRYLVAGLTQGAVKG